MPAIKFVLKKNRLFVILILFFITILSVESWYFFASQKAKSRLAKNALPIGQTTAASSNPSTAPSRPQGVPVATGSQPRQINITATGLEPPTLVVKPHIEIVFANQTSQALTFKDKGAKDGLPLPPSGRLSMVYDTADTLEYEIIGLPKSLEGKIIIK